MWHNGLRTLACAFLMAVLAVASAFAQENQAQIANFLRHTPNAELRQQIHLLPDARHDGFFYALLRRIPA